MKLIRFFLFFGLSLIILSSVIPVLAEARAVAKIAFASNRDGNSEIYIMNPDGSEQVNLTRHRAHDFSPAWSPTGKQILFASERGGKTTDIYVMDADGSDVRRVFRERVERRHPTWAPDGSEIAFMSAHTLLPIKDGFGAYRYPNPELRPLTCGLMPKSKLCQKDSR